MAKRTRLGFLDEIKEKAHGMQPAAADESEGAQEGRSFMQQRKERIAQVDNKTKALEMRPVRRVDPAKCRIRDGHNRRYDLLNEQRCKDLIDSIKAQGQQIPAIVREVEDDPAFYYEIIAGSRRKWVAEHLDRPLLVEIRTLTDREAFQLADAENRTREDISDYERAIEYAGALKSFFTSQKQMAAAMEVSEAWLTYYLQLASFPDDVVGAFPSIFDIKTSYAKKLSPLLNDKRKRESVIQRAREIRAESEREGGYRRGTEVFKALVAAGEARPKKGGLIVDETYTSTDGNELFRVTRAARGGVKIEFPKGLAANREELERLLIEAARKHVGH